MLVLPSVRSVRRLWKLWQSCGVAFLVGLLENVRWQNLPLPTCAQGDVNQTRGRHVEAGKITCSVLLNTRKKQRNGCATSRLSRLFSPWFRSLLCMQQDHHEIGLWELFLFHCSILHDGILPFSLLCILAAWRRTSQCELVSARAGNLPSLPPLNAPSNQFSTLTM